LFFLEKRTAKILEKVLFLKKTAKIFRKRTFVVDFLIFL
jgi:hypothetical protein